MIRTHYSGQLSGEDDGKKVTLAGWAQHIRVLGNIAFIKLRDREGIAQVIIKKKDGDLFEKIKEINLTKSLQLW